MDVSALKKVFVLGVLVVSLGAASEAQADDNVTLRWNAAMLQGTRDTGFPPMRAARGFAILHTCM